jgi:hypothetical protein
MLSTVTAWALAVGSVPEEMMADVKIKAVRSFNAGKYAPKPGTFIAVGEVVSVPKLLALELVASNKAEFFIEPEAAEPEAKPAAKGAKRNAE